MDQRSSMSRLSPLTEPSLAAAPSRLDETLVSVPLLKRIAAAAGETRRRRLKARQIAAQIAARPTTVAIWGEDPNRRAVAAIVCCAIRDLFGWPNAHFIPDDRLGLLTRGFCDELNMTWPDNSFVGRFGLANGQINPSEMTLGQLVDHILQMPRPCRKCGYDLRASPERCPECGTPVWPEST